MVKPFHPARAAELLAKAEKSWGFHQRHRDDPAYPWSPGARLFAAGQLYLATAQPPYHEAFRQVAAQVFELEGRKSSWPAQYHGLYYNLDTIEKGAVFTHYFASYFYLSRDLGPVPGLVIYGITDPPGAAAYIRAVTQHLYPAMNDLPPARRVTDGWSVVGQNEFTVWETMAPNAFLHACLAPEKPRQGRLLPWSGVRLPGGYPGSSR